VARNRRWRGVQTATIDEILLGARSQSPIAYGVTVTIYRYRPARTPNPPIKISLGYGPRSYRSSQLKPIRRIKPQFLKTFDGGTTPLGAVIQKAIDAATTAEMHASAIR
jgi:hypothetical protein